MHTPRLVVKPPQAGARAAHKRWQLSAENCSQSSSGMMVISTPGFSVERESLMEERSPLHPVPEWLDSTRWSNSGAPWTHHPSAVPRTRTAALAATPTSIAVPHAPSPAPYRALGAKHGVCAGEPSTVRRLVRAERAAASEMLTLRESGKGRYGVPQMAVPEVTVHARSGGDGGEGGGGDAHSPHVTFTPSPPGLLELHVPLTPPMHATEAQPSMLSPTCVTLPSGQVHVAP